MASSWAQRTALGATVLTLAGGAGTLALSASAAGSPAPTPFRLQVDSTSCEETGGAGHATHGSCTYILTDGRRFKCPLRFSRTRQTPASLERAKACHALTPIQIPASWTPVLERLYAAQACLARHHVSADGGPAFGAPQSPTTPVGELITYSTRPTAFIGFYTTARGAKRAERRARANARRLGAGVERRRAVTIFWLKPPAPALRATADACVFS